MAKENWVNIGSGNGLLADGTKPLPEPMLCFHQWVDVHLRGNLKEIFQSPIVKISLKINYLKFHSDLQGTNELNQDLQSIFIGLKLYFWVHKYVS